jgi:aconitate hydratase
MNQEMTAVASQDSFGAKSTLDVDGKSSEIFRLDAVTGDGVDVASLPYSLKVLLENLLRTEDGANITADDIRGLGPRGRAGQGDPVHAGTRDPAGLHRRAVHRRPRDDARGHGRARR